MSSDGLINQGDVLWVASAPHGLSQLRGSYLRMDGPESLNGFVRLPHAAG